MLCLSYISKLDPLIGRRSTGMDPSVASAGSIVPKIPSWWGAEYLARHLTNLQPAENRF